MASMQEITCKCGCGRKKMVRTADVKRGWGRFYSKSCKAKHQERRTGQYKDYCNRKEWFDEFGFRVECCGPVSMMSGMDGHGQQ